MTSKRHDTPSPAMTLEPFAAKHFEELAGWFSDERELVLWGGPKVRFPLDVSQLRGMLSKGPPARPERLSYMARHAGAWVGHAQLVFDWRNELAVLARVAVAPAARGRGWALELVRTVVDQAFAREGLARVELSVYPQNVAAWKTYERAGFLREGTRRSSCRMGDERWDTVVMGVLAQEWARARE